MIDTGNGAQDALRRSERNLQLIIVWAEPNDGPGATFSFPFPARKKVSALRRPRSRPHDN